MENPVIKQMVLAKYKKPFVFALVVFSFTAQAGNIKAGGLAEETVKKCSVFGFQFSVDDREFTSWT